MLLVGGDRTPSPACRTSPSSPRCRSSLVMVGLAVALVKDLRHDPLMVRRQYAAEAVEHAVVHGVTEHGDDFVLSVEKGETHIVRDGVEDEHALHDERHDELEMDHARR